MKRDAKALVTVLGYVDPHDWDSQGRLVRVSISTDEGCYVISPAGLGGALLEMVDKEVQVAGTIEEHDEEMYMTVKTFEAVDDFDFSEMDDEVEPGLEPWVEEPDAWTSPRARR